MPNVQTHIRYIVSRPRAYNTARNGSRKRFPVGKRRLRCVRKRHVVYDTSPWLTGRSDKMFERMYTIRGTCVKWDPRPRQNAMRHFVTSIIELVRTVVHAPFLRKAYFRLPSTPKGHESIGFSSVL